MAFIDFFLSRIVVLHGDDGLANNWVNFCIAFWHEAEAWPEDNSDELELIEKKSEGFESFNGVVDFVFAENVHRVDLVAVADRVLDESLTLKDEDTVFLWCGKCGFFESTWDDGDVFLAGHQILKIACIDWSETCEFMNQAEKRSLQEHAARANEHITKSAKVDVHAETDCEYGMRVHCKKHFFLV